MNINIIEIKNFSQVQNELTKIDCDPVGIHILKPKLLFRVIKVENIRSKAANILKQTFLGKGGDVAVSRHAADLSEEYTDVLIGATMKQYRLALAQLKVQPWGLASLAEKIEQILRNVDQLPNRKYNWQDRNLTIDHENSLIMGILNVTPDSFSDGNKYNCIDQAIRRVEELQIDGADMIDIGAESTRPYGGNEKISADQEMERLIPILEAVLPYCKVPVSVDTYKASVAEAALQYGAHIINDIWGLQYDEEMAKVVAKYDVPVVVMHNKNENDYPEGIMHDMDCFFRKSIDIGRENGIKRENIIIDPGIGFAKTTAQNLYVMSKLEAFRALDCPILLGTSRKRFIGDVLNLPVHDRVEGTLATAALGKTKGVQIHRVHDVKQVKRILKMMDVMTRSGENDEDFD
ncbi:dihydropteroate synthase [Massilibacillus massiliensis]